MMQLDKRLQKLEAQVNAIFYKKKIVVIQYEGESDEDAIRLKGYPANEENRQIWFISFPVKIDHKTRETTLMKRGADPFSDHKLFDHETI